MTGFLKYSRVVHSRPTGDGLALGVLRVGDGLTVNDVLEEDLEHAARPLVDETGEGLHAATTARRRCLVSMLSLRTETLK